MKTGQVTEVIPLRPRIMYSPPENMPQTMQHYLPESLVLVIFGGSGDLTKRKLIPSLYQLFKQDKLPIRFSVLGLGRTEYSDVAYREHLFSATSAMESTTLLLPSSSSLECITSRWTLLLPRTILSSVSN